MIPSPADLLRVLGSGVRPDGQAQDIPAASGADFERMLAQARAGTLETGLPVTVAEGAGVELDATQLERLGRAVDRAHAEGATRVVVLMDGMSLDVDVLSRRVLGPADTSGGRVVTGIDGLIRLGKGDDPAAATVLPLPRGNSMDKSLLDMLAERDGRAA